MSDSSAILKEMYAQKKKRTIPHMADGGLVSDTPHAQGEPPIPEGFQELPPQQTRFEQDQASMPRTPADPNTPTLQPQPSGLWNDLKGSMNLNTVRNAGKYLLDDGRVGQNAPQDEIQPDYNSPVDIAANIAGGYAGKALARGAEGIIGNEVGSLGAQGGGKKMVPKGTFKNKFDVDAYHGTKADISEFSKDALGSSTGAKSARQAFFFAQDPSTAGDYANLAESRLSLREAAGEQVPETVSGLKSLHTEERLKQLQRNTPEQQKSYIQQLQDGMKVVQDELNGTLPTFKDYDGVTKTAFPRPKDYLEERLQSYKDKINDAHAMTTPEAEAARLAEIKQLNQLLQDTADAKNLEHTGQNVLPVKLRMENPYVHDFKGAPYRDEPYSAIIEKAKAAGHDSVHFKNTYDPADPENRVKQSIYAVFEPHQIRSKFAAFDPKKAKSGKLSYAEGGEVQAPEGFEEMPTSASTGEPPIPAGFEEMPAPTLGGYAAAGARGLGEGILGPVAPLTEQMFRSGVLGTPREKVQEEQRASREDYPTTHLVGEVAGLGASMAAGVGLGSATMHLGEAAAAHALPDATGALAARAAGFLGPEVAGATPLAKIGSRAVSDLVANAAISSGDEVTKLVIGDPDSMETAAVNVGLGGLIGGVAGTTFGGAGQLWEASGLSGKAGHALHALANHLGGIEGQVSSPAEELLSKAGVELSPELTKVVEGDVKAQQLSADLLQTDASAGKKYQKLYQDQHDEIADSMIGALGHDPETPINTDMSKYEHGKSIGETLAKEYHEQVSPISKEFEKVKDKFADKELIPDRNIVGPPDHSNPYDPKPGQKIRTPGTISEVTDKISQLSEKEGWTASPSSEIMTEVNRVLKELPKQKTLKDLGNYITAVGDNTASKLPFGQQTPLSRAGGMIKSILRDAESDVAIQRLGEKEGPEAVAAFKQARTEFAEQARKRDYLNDNLKSGGSVSNFAKGLKEMAQTDGESIANRLSGKGNADLLRFLEQNYPKTAQAVKAMHVNGLLSNAASKATEGKISIQALRSSLEKMSPELRSFVANPETLSKIDALGQVVDKLNPKNYNYSNTARTLASKLSDMAASSAGVIAALTGHGPIAALLTTVMGKYLTHEAPATMKLALLKFMASGAKIDAPAFKAMLQSMDATVKGESLLSKAAKNVFKADREVLPESLRPQEKDRVRLQKQLDEINTNPQKLMNGNNKVAHYMPSTAESQAQTVARSSQYLNALRPAVKQATPLDTPIKPSTSEKAAYDNALNIAHQPLLVMNKVKAGTATPADVAALKAMYPALYNRMASKMTAEMTEHLSKGEIIPYKTKLGLSQFLQQPMDSTMLPFNIQAAQPVPAQPTASQPQAPQSGVKPPSASSMKGMDKLAASYNTQDQARNKRSLKDR